MGKISDYANVLKSKLTDLFVVYQRDNGELETKNATLEQLGDAICGEQVHATLETDNQTIIGGINELAKDKNVADEYDATQTYDKGDVVIYKNTLYICTTNNTTGAWDATKWTATTVQSLIGDLSELTTSDKSSLVGAVNEVNGKTKPTTVTPTFNSSQSNYSIPFNNTRVYKIGNVVYFSSTIQADTPYGSSPGQNVYSGLPKPYANDSLYMGFCAWNVTSNNMRVIVTSDGKLQCRGGNTGTAYDVAFSYVCQ